MRKGTVYTHDTRAGSPGGRGGGVGGWVGRGHNQSVCGQQRQGVGSKLNHSSLHLGVRGSPCCVHPSWAPQHRQGARDGSPSQPCSRLWGLRQSLGLGRNGLRGGTKPGASRKGSTFPPRAPVKAGGISPSVLPRKGWGGVGGWSLQTQLIFRSS